MNQNFMAMKLNEMSRHGLGMEGQLFITFAHFLHFPWLSPVNYFRTSLICNASSTSSIAKRQ